MAERHWRFRPKMVRDLEAKGALMEALFEAQETTLAEMEALTAARNIFCSRHSMRFMADEIRSSVGESIWIAETRPFLDQPPVASNHRRNHIDRGLVVESFARRRAGSVR